MRLRDADATVIGLPAFEEDAADSAEDAAHDVTRVESSWLHDAVPELPAGTSVAPSGPPPAERGASQSRALRRRVKRPQAIRAAPVDLRRLALVVRRSGARCLFLAVLASMVTALLAPRFVKTKYEATSVVSWLPPANQQVSQMQNMTTFSDSVLLSANMERVAAIVGEPPQNAAALLNSVTVRNNPMSAVMPIVAMAATPERSAALANATADVFIESRRQLAASRSIEVAGALRALLTQREKSLADAVAKYDEFRRSHRINNLVVEQESAVKEVSRLRDLEHDVRIESDGMRVLSGALAAARKSSPELVVMSQTHGATQTGNTMEATQADLSRARAMYTEEHPLVRALAAEVEAFRVSPRRVDSSALSTTRGRNPIRESLTARVEEVRANELSFAEKRRTVLAMEKEAAARVEELSAAESQDARMQADIRVQREQRAAMLTQIAQAEQDVGAATSDFVVVARATPQETLAQARAPRVVFLVGVGVLLLGLLWQLRPARVVAAREAAFWLDATPLATTDYPCGGVEKLTALSVDTIIALIEAGAERIGVAALVNDASANELPSALVDHIVQNGGSWSPRRLSEFAGHRDVPRPVAGSREIVDCGALAASERALRGARRHMDAVLLLVQAGTPVWTLRRLASRLGLEKGTLYVAVVGADTAVAAAVS